MQQDRRKAELVQRRHGQQARVPFNVVVEWEKLNQKRRDVKMPPLLPPRLYRSRYSGAMLRAIRARKMNFLGETQR